MTNMKVKPTVHYVCDYCGTEYNTEEDCEKCEKAHLKPEKIVRLGYNYGVGIGMSYFPEKISVEFSNGTVRDYEII